MMGYNDYLYIEKSIKDIEKFIDNLYFNEDTNSVAKPILNDILGDFTNINDGIKQLRKCFPPSTTRKKVI